VVICNYANIRLKVWLEMQNNVFESGLWFWTGLNTQQSISSMQTTHATTWQWADGTSANMSLMWAGFINVWC